MTEWEKNLLVKSYLDNMGKKTMWKENIITELDGVLVSPPSPLFVLILRHDCGKAKKCFQVQHPLMTELWSLCFSWWLSWIENTEKMGINFCPMYVWMQRRLKCDLETWVHISSCAKFLKSFREIRFLWKKKKVIEKYNSI